jgi:hypothetical protein
MDTPDELLMVFQKLPEGGDGTEWRGQRVVAIRAVDESGREWPIPGPGCDDVQPPDDFGFFAVKTMQALHTIEAVNFDYAQEIRSGPTLAAVDGGAVLPGLPGGDPMK